MKYRCMCCGTEFDEPAVREERIWHIPEDGIFEDRLYYVCPICGEEETYFEPLEDNEEDE